MDAVEAHGTGTRLGDPIEARALLATYGQGRPEDRPLLLGTVKSNIGHTQAAAGVAGVIKMVMAMRHATLPATLHAAEPTPHVDWSAGAVRLLTEPTAWPQADHPRRAAISSFGFSGTNAHLILEQAPGPGPERQSQTTVAPAASEASFASPGRGGPAGASRPGESVTAGSVANGRSVGLVFTPQKTPWVLSAKSAEGLCGQARALEAYLAAHPELGPAEVGWSLVRARSVFEHRAVIAGDEQVAGLAAVAGGREHPDVVTGAAGDGGAGPVFVFAGQGSQWAGMGAELLGSSPVFAARIAECERALAPFADWSLTEVLRGDGAGLGRVDVVQPVLWAVMVSLAAVWEHYGVRPAAVTGHSQGEIAAACVAGALSLEDGARVVALRSQALRELSGHGAMASLLAGEQEVARLLEDAGGVSVAAVNSPSSTVVSGPPGQVAAVVAAAQQRGVRARLIEVDYASHGPQVDQITAGLTQALAGITPASSQVPFYSALTGTRIDAAGLDTGYWVANLRQPVRFAATIAALLADGHRTFIETSPHPVLTTSIEECIDITGMEAAALPTLHRDHGGPGQLTRALAQAFTRGIAIDWTREYPDPPPRIIDLPTYAFQRERYWLSAPDTAVRVTDLGLAPTGHPVLEASLKPADGDGRVLTGRVSRQRLPWLADHVIAGIMLVPGAAQVEWVLRAADEAGCGRVDEFVLHTPLTVPASGALDVQVVVGAAGPGGQRDAGVYSRAGHDAAWTTHATGVLGPQPTAAASLPDGSWPPPGAEPTEVTGFYGDTGNAGYGYGPVFQCVRAVWRHGADVLAELELPDVVPDRDGFGIHPALLDAALHPLLLMGEFSDGKVWLPFTWSGVTLHAVGATSARVRLSPLGEGLDHGVRVSVTDPAGAPVLDAASVVLREVGHRQLRTAHARGTGDVFTIEWIAAPEAGDDAVPHEDRVVEVASATEALERLQGWLAEPDGAGERLAFVTRGAVGDDPDPDAAAAWGLVRSAQAEHPGRFVLIDLDEDADAGIS